MKLSILICSIESRKAALQEVLEKFYTQIHLYQLNDSVEIITAVDNKEISVGQKRQNLLQQANGEWIVYFDDDDDPSHDYVQKIIRPITEHPDIDCLGIRGIMTTNGTNEKSWCHRLGYPIKGDGRVKTEYGYDYVRPIIHFNPARRDKALQAGFRDLRFGEDMDYAERLNKILTKEYFIDDVLFHYRFSSKAPHNEKYGIQ